MCKPCRPKCNNYIVVYYFRSVHRGRGDTDAGMVHACEQEKCPDSENEPAFPSVSISFISLSWNNAAYPICTAVSAPRHNWCLPGRLSALQWCWRQTDVVWPFEFILWVTQISVSRLMILRLHPSLYLCISGKPKLTSTTSVPPFIVTS